MKRNLIHILLAATFLLSACGGNPAQPTPTAGSVIQESSSTPSPLPSPTRTAQPTATPIPATRTVTPLPTIPTFTPTFDAQTIVTVTPASPAECPKEDSAIIPEFHIRIYPECMEKGICLFGGTEEEILEFLNRGGPMASTIQRLSKADWGENYYGKAKGFVYQDITGDSQPELIIENFDAAQRVYILYCQDGKYKLYPPDQSQENQYGTESIYAIEDMNLNGLPEVTTINLWRGGLGVIIHEWDGKEFVDRIYAGTDGFDDFQIKDINYNGTKELIVRGGRPCIGCIQLETPWRHITTVYMWNGQLYVPLPPKYDSPVYRYQAIEDADRLVMEGKLDEALLLYQDAIFSDKLEWWSHDRWEYEVMVSQYAYSSLKPTLPSLPTPDESEYPRLAAYAYYRIMLLQVVKGHESDAGTVYKTLLQKFGDDQYGRPYAEMATNFWNEYQTTHDLTTACAKAIQYAAKYSTLLDPLEGPSLQDLKYAPADVCPFR